MAKTPNIVQRVLARHRYGYVDRLRGGMLEGWAWLPGQPDFRCSVGVWQGRDLVATIVANRFRYDLYQAEIGDGAHGFRAKLPPEIRIGDLTVAIIENNRVLHGARRYSGRLNAMPELKMLIGRLHKNRARIKGLKRKIADK